MGYVTVEVDTRAVLRGMSDAELREELHRRAARRTAEISAAQRKRAQFGEPWSPAGLAEDLRKAFYNRDASRFEALLCVLERHEAVAA